MLYHLRDADAESWLAACNDDYLADAHARHTGDSQILLVARGSYEEARRCHLRCRARSHAIARTAALFLDRRVVEEAKTR